MAARVLVWVLCLAWAWATSLDTPPDTSSAVSPSLRVVGTRLEVDFGPADPGAQLLLLLLPDPGQGCLSPRALVFRRENITVRVPRLCKPLWQKCIIFVLYTSSFVNEHYFAVF